MEFTYFKRYRMEVDLQGRDLSTPPLPAGYQFQAWQPDLLEAFAEAKYRSFRNEMDANVFPCLGVLSGCRRLMAEISARPGFLPGATWLLSYCSPSSPAEPCGVVQGIRDSAGFGAIQNIGVAPEHRNRGLGTQLLYRALEGFSRAGIGRAYLEVTAHNEGAIRLYRRLGFVVVKTVYKPAEPIFDV
jgi:hypothetical protein